MAQLGLQRPLSGKSHLEWTVCEHENEWEEARRRVKPAIRPPVRSVRRRGGAVLAALLLIVGIGGIFLLAQADREMAQVEAALHATVAAESWTRRHAPEAVAAWVDPAADPVWQEALAAAPTTPNGSPTTAALGPETPQVHRVEVHGQWALVEVVVDQPEETWLTSPYRQTRVYRETPDGWRRTAPPSLLWHPLATHRVGRFTFVFGRRDAAAVLEAAPQIVEVDRTLHHDLGLPETEQPLTVHVEAALPPTLDPAILFVLAGVRELHVPSPALLALPVDLTDADALRQLVSEVLVPQAVAEAMGGDEVRCRWVPLQKGLTLWLQAEHSALLSSSRFRLDQSRRPLLIPPDPLAAYVLHADDCGGGGYTPYTRVLESVNVTMTMLVEHVVSTYGRDSLAALAAGTQRYASWEELVPTVFGVSVEEFEAGWHRYRATQVGLDLDMNRKEVVRDPTEPASSGGYHFNKWW